MRISRTAVLQLAIVALLLAALLAFSQGTGKSKAQDQDLVQVLPDAELTGAALVGELGCNNCHGGLDGPNKVQNLAPDLSDAGLRYNPAYIFEFLQNPTRVRQHLGHTRMPNFHLSAEESLALTEYLSSLRLDKTAGAEFPEISDRRGDAARGKALLSELSCLTCHNNGIEGNGQINDLSATAYRINRDWVSSYLVAPHRYNSKENLMPALFYQVNPDSISFKQLVPEADQKIRDINTYLYSLNERKSDELAAAFKAARKTYPKADAAAGQAIFTALNCTSCHRSPVRGAWKEKNAPDLSFEGSRVQQSWLQDYLKQPHAIRTRGYFPGSGSRMPDFKLSSQEVELLADFLMDQTKGIPGFEPKNLSAFQANKAAALLSDKLACLGCHQLDGEGGVIGPDLSGLNKRLNPDYMMAMISDPHQLSAEVVMPKIPMDPRYRELIAHYLWNREADPVQANYASLLDVPLLLEKNLDSPQAVYRTYCANCHGMDGKADGFNADHLPVSPTQHANGAYLATRTDDVLFDGIYAGGYILNKSHFMPAWGETLSNEQMLGLVAYMRELCGCDQPGWAADN